MARILINPSSRLCPDFTLEVFHQIRLPLVNEMTNHDQATILLTDLWSASNAAKKLLWQVQSDADELDAQAARQLQAEANALSEAEKQKEKEDLG